MKDARIGKGWFPLLLISTLGYSNTPIMPIWLASASERLHLDVMQSGFVASMELGSLAASSIAWATLLRSNPRVLWLGLAIVASIAASALSIAADDLQLLIASRLVVGLANGLVLAEITRRAAQMPGSHRIFAMQQLALVVFAAIFFGTSPVAMAALGGTAPFLYSLVLGGLALLSVPLIPAGPQARPDAGAAGASASAPVKFLTGTSVLIFAAIILNFMSQGALFTYVTRAAQLSGLDFEEAGRILAIGAPISLIAPIAAERMGLRFGRTAPLAAGHAGLAISILAVAMGAGAAWFAPGAVGLTLFILFLVPFLLGMLAELDASGRAASAGPAFITVGSAIGPTLGGYIISHAGFPALGIAGALGVGLALTLSLVANARLPGAR